MITIPALESCTDILDSDLLLITHANGNSEKMTGAEYNKRGQVILASTKILTGTPLKSGYVVRVLFTEDQTAQNNSEPMVITYNTVDITVKICKNGALANYIPFEVSAGVYKYCQAYTSMELVYDGTNFIVLGNPVVLSDTDTTTFADGLKRVNTIASGNKGMVTSEAVLTAIKDSFNFVRVISIPANTSIGAVSNLGTFNCKRGYSYVFVLSIRLPANSGEYAFRALGATSVDATTFDQYTPPRKSFNSQHVNNITEIFSQSISSEGSGSTVPYYFYLRNTGNNIVSSGIGSVFVFEMKTPV